MSPVRLNTHAVANHAALGKDHAFWQWVKDRADAAAAKGVYQDDCGDLRTLDCTWTMTDPPESVVSRL